MDKTKYFGASSVVGSVTVPVWGRVSLRSPSLSELRSLENITDETKIMLSTVACCVCDESGNRVFSDDDMDQLATVSFSILQEVSKAAIKQFNMPTLVEDAKKNSPETAASDSPSICAENSASPT